ncbi:MAG: sulfatase-like hydrolase/transferase [Kiritimatiellales bacterium]
MKANELLACLALPLLPAVAYERPNILLIVADDQGSGDIGYNNPLVHTPNIDRLAGESAVFTDFISAPACAPARTALLTGRNHFHAGVWGVRSRAYINRDEVLLPEYFRRAGYRTAHFGKWDTRAPEFRTYNTGYTESGVLVTEYAHQNPVLDFDGIMQEFSGWTSDILADLTIRFIERNAAAGEPWLAVTAFIAPHSPWVSAPEFSAPLRQKGYSKPLAELYGMIEQMDAAAGKIFTALDRLGQTDNTLVIYMSDNGATPVCPRTGGTPMDGADWENRNPFNLRGRKSELWENGIRVPFFVHWPAKIPAGERAQLGAVEDILPTILDLAGISDEIVPGHLPFQGLSLKPVLMNPQLPDQERAYFRLPIAPPGMPLPMERDRIGIINDLSETDYTKDVHAVLYTPEYKFHHLPGGAVELYDAKTDAPESNNLSGKLPQLTAAFAEDCRQQWNRLVNSSRRTLTMPYFLIGDPRYKNTASGNLTDFILPDTIPGDAPLKVFGNARSPYSYHGKSGGFAAPEDSVVFGAEVITAGKYRVIVTGKNFSKSLPIVLNVVGNKSGSGCQPLASGRDAASTFTTGKNCGAGIPACEKGRQECLPHISTDTELDFGELFFDAGKHELHFSGTGEKADAEEALITLIEFRSSEKILSDTECFLKGMTDEQKNF